MTLIFVYNADSGAINTIMDVGHKLFSTKTYPCSLCALTYDTFTEKKAWKSFRKKSTLDMVFYHKDEFESIYPNTNFTYPVILRKNDLNFTEVLSHKDLDYITDVNVLIEKLVNHL